MGIDSCGHQSIAQWGDLHGQNTFSSCTISWGILLGGHLGSYLVGIFTLTWMLSQGDLLLQNIFVHNLANILTVLSDFFCLHIGDILTTSWRKRWPLMEDNLIFIWRTS
jgi:hypothetical protein